jgi:DNA-binding GntR family transcriptional regulator
MHGEQHMPTVQHVPIHHDAGKPVWMQLTDILRDEIAKMPTGRMLPSVRTLMQTYEVSGGTVKHAIGQLRDEGLIVTYQGRGSYVAERP